MLYMLRSSQTLPPFQKRTKCMVLTIKISKMLIGEARGEWRHCLKKIGQLLGISGHKKLGWKYIKVQEISVKSGDMESKRSPFNSSLLFLDFFCGGGGGGGCLFPHLLPGLFVGLFFVARRRQFNHLFVSLSICKRRCSDPAALSRRSQQYV